MKLSQLVAEAGPDLSYTFSGLHSGIEAITTNGNRDVGGDLLVIHFSELKSLSMLDVDSVAGKMMIIDCPKFSDASHMPIEIHGSLTVSGCESLQSLHGINRRLRFVGGNVIVRRCDIRSHVLGLLLIKIAGTIQLDVRPVTQILNQYKNQGRAGVLAAQRDLNKLGLKEYAQL